MKPAYFCTGQRDGLLFHIETGNPNFVEVAERAEAFSWKDGSTESPVEYRTILYRRVPIVGLPHDFFVPNKWTDGDLIGYLAKRVDFLTAENKGLKKRWATGFRSHWEAR